MPAMPIWIQTGPGITLRCTMPMPSRHLAAGRFHPELLFRPRSIAVVGTATPEGRDVLANVTAGDAPAYAGGLFTAEAPADVAGFDGAPDLAFICCADVAGAMAALARRGTMAAVVLTMAGDLAALARELRMRVYGPGSFGIAVPSIGLHAIRSHLRPRLGRAALVSQSAALCRAVLDWAEPNGVGFSHVVGVGGNQDLGFAIVLDWLSRDSGTGVILLDIRRIKNARHFLSAARAAARLRPVVAIRPGGRLIDPQGGADAAFLAALRRAGVLCVDRFDDLLSAAETLTRARPARGDALAIVTNAVGPARLAADAALRDGLALAPLSEETRAVLRLALPREAVGGDIAYVGPSEPIRLAEVAALLAGAREVGGVLIVHAPTGPADAVAVEAIVAASRAIRVPLLVCAMGETTGAAHRRRLAEAGVAVFAAPEQAVRGFGHLVQNRRNRAAARELPSSAVLTLAPDRATVAALVGSVRGAGRTLLLQDEALAVVSAYGVPTVPCRVAQSPDDAAEAAALLGFPVVVKRRRVDRSTPIHGPGGLALDLRDEGQVRRAAERLDEHRPADAPPGVLVQRQVGRARELRIGASLDPLFGPTIRFGAGGTAAALRDDLVVDLPPFNLSLAHALIARSSVAAALGALPDAPAVAVDAVADTLVRISQLLVDFPDIAELDVNPLFADAAGVLAADAFLRLRGAGDPPWHLALPPYPAELAGTFDARGETLVIRPIRPEDAEAHAAFFARLDPDDIRYRFFATLRELSPERIARMTQVDYDREMAFIAVRPPTGQMVGGQMVGGQMVGGQTVDIETVGIETVGVGRLVRDGETAQGEFAVIVQTDMKGCGLASHLMHRLIDWGRSRGLTEIVGQVLAENTPMLAFVRRLGMTTHASADDPGVIEARLPLAR
jgi:acetyltransferase